ncbi:DUF3857 domain-containing protein [Roseivirga sp. BDSF3-8]|uniref:DUF3857 domain-containing protein n=1 Tax=Roseivirga sp. BDSF3-8 TaxID=3241598 RepID=UPI003531A02E
MKITVKLLLGLATFFLISTSLIAKNPSKWGELTSQEITLKEVPFDKDAHAVVLNYYGELRYMPGSQPRLDVHKRIKILDKEGLDAANVAISYYADENIENVVGLKAQALLIRNGQVENVKLGKDEIYEVETGRFTKEIRFTYSGVQPGDVIEYSYGIYTKNNVSLWDIMFQHEYPALQSGLQALIHPDLGVRIFFHGERLNRKYGGEATNEWVLTNVAALKDEPYTWNLKDYAEWVEFQLDEYYYRSDYAGIDSKTINRSWEQIAGELNEDYDFTGYFTKGYYLRRMLEECGADTLSGLAKAKKIYRYVQTTYKWNHVNSRYPDRFVIFNDKKEGNIASINMLLAALLRKAGFEVSPALASTKYHGLIMEHNPVISQFNTVLCLMHYEGKNIFLNAVNPYLGFGYLRDEDQNGKAFMVNKANHGWVEITSLNPSVDIVMEQVSIADGRITRKISLKSEGVQASDLREFFNSIEEDELAGKYETGIYEFSDAKLENLDNPDEPLKFSYTMTSPVDEAGDLIILSPVLLHSYDESPFVNEERSLPVDFASSYSEKYIVNIQIPNGYVVEDLPQSEKVVLPDQGGSMLFMSHAIGSMVQVQILVEINKTFFSVSEYPGLRTMFERVVAKFAEHIVFKKKEEAQKP